MNEIRRYDREAEEAAQIRDIVGRRKLPDFLTGYDVLLGDFDGDPAMWIVFRTLPSGSVDYPELQRRAELRTALEESLRDELLSVGDRFPYFRYEPA